MVCLLRTDNIPCSSAGAVPEEGGMVITGSRVGAGASKLRTESIPMTVDEAEAAQDAVQTRVRKGLARPTEEQIMKHSATPPPLLPPLPFRDWCVPCIAGKASDWLHSQITHSSPQRYRCVSRTTSWTAARTRDILTVLNFCIVPRELLLCRPQSTVMAGAMEKIRATPWQPKITE